ncbi:sorting-associated 41 homolog isoform X1 [Octopus vulgaris]|uniref:Sorting-associated 41 homolog isoform X1 n=2 Tax=Octopus TaxID=6643 RepID=A0AA36BJN1_OCTVU|nr:vacuolar protein sorting-associated protein 41 homolog isoform X3 [Octopus sinensis]CAI9735685.1 sorting-associated 41 homolog isoform X1 [Octopus vulgaris]
MADTDSGQVEEPVMIWFYQTEKDEEGGKEEEESEEEAEPKLKYERLVNDLTKILNKDAASCMAVHSKFLALGTHNGAIHILDHAGYNIKDIQAHNNTVNQISIDDSGDYIASCSDDGHIIITGLYSSENDQSKNFDRPIKAIALDPQFSKPGSGKHYISGDDKLVLGEKNFLGRYKNYVLHKGEGPIRNIKWKSFLIAWANDKGVKIYDMSLECRITNIPKDHSNRPDLYQCNLCWKDDRTLLVGWADLIKICVVRDKTSDVDANMPERFVEITHMFTTTPESNCYICGIAPLENNLVVFTYDKEGQHIEGGKFKADRPHLQIWEPEENYYEEISDDALSFRGFEEYRCFDYHLECVVEESLYFLISPKDVVVAKLRDQDDHITWLLEHERYEDAMESAMAHSRELKKHNVQELGKQYLDHLLEAAEYEEAAQLCVRILGRKKELWESTFEKFNDIGQLKILAPHLPCGDPLLSPHIYEVVLNEFLRTDHEGFLHLIRSWPHNLYNMQVIINILLNEHEKDRNNLTLLECLGELYIFQKRYDKALTIYLQMKHKDVFNLINKHNLFDSITDRIVQLMEFDSEKAVILLLDNIEKIPIKKVVQQLEPTPELLHRYLDKLFQKDPHLGQEYHAMQIKLYAEYDREKLLPLLKNSTHCPLQAALEECRIRNFLPEQVFLLNKMGDTKGALHVIMELQNNVQKAIDFCKEHNDKELWDDLITFSINKPGFITGLLQNIGTHVDPIILIKRIQNGMQIPKLRDSLVKILQDYQIQIALLEGCQKILVKDSYSLLTKQIKTRQRGYMIDCSISDGQKCGICEKPVIENDQRCAQDLYIFFCRHSFHRDCMEGNGSISCFICNSGPAVSQK